MAAMLTLLTGCLVNTELYEARKRALSDDDADGYSDDEGDCNDYAASVYPGATEICNGIDDDCNGLEDDHPADAIWYRDADSDGWGDEESTIVDCSSSVNGYAKEHGDCDDTNPDIAPDAVEVYGDDVDQDCTGQNDDGPAGPFSVTSPDLSGASYVDSWTWTSPHFLTIGTEVRPLTSGCDAFIYELNNQDGTVNQVVDAEAVGWCIERPDGILEFTVPAHPEDRVSNLPEASDGWNVGIYIDDTPWLAEGSDAWTCMMVYLPPDSSLTARSGRDCAPVWGSDDTGLVNLFTTGSPSQGSWEWICLDPDDEPGVDAASGVPSSEWPNETLTAEVPEGRPFCTAWGQMLTGDPAQDAHVYVAGFVHAGTFDSWTFEIDVEGCADGCTLYNNLNADYAWIGRPPKTLTGDTATFAFDMVDLLGVLHTATSGSFGLEANRQLSTSGVDAGESGWWVDTSRTTFEAAGVYANAVLRSVHGSQTTTVDLACGLVSANETGGYQVDLMLGPSTIRSAGDAVACEDYTSGPYLELTVAGCDEGCVLGQNFNALSTWSQLPPTWVDGYGATWALEPSTLEGTAGTTRQFAVDGVSSSPDGWWVTGSTDDWSVPGLFAPGTWWSAYGADEASLDVGCDFITTSAPGVFGMAARLEKTAIVAAGTLAADECVLEY